MFYDPVPEVSRKLVGGKQLTYNHLRRISYEREAVEMKFCKCR